MIFNAQSTSKVSQGETFRQNTKSKFDSQCTSHITAICRRTVGGNEAELTEKKKIRKTETLVVSDACKAIFWETSKIIFDSSIFSAKVTLLYAHSYPPWIAYGKQNLGGSKFKISEQLKESTFWAGRPVDCCIKWE